MIIVRDTQTCGICKSKEAVVFCDGCEVPLCRDCRQFDIWCYGCGHGDTKAFCSVCYDDIEINLFGGKVPD